jgi:tetratricopeptide (TPR) repeat protein
MSWNNLLQWIEAHKDALGWLFGTGVLGAAYKLIAGLLQRRREQRLRREANPFRVFPPGSDLLPAVFPSSSNSPLNDDRIPYRERIPGRSVRREMEDLLREKRALLVCGRSGLGKTREAAHLAQTLNREGWTALYLPPDTWLEPPARLPQGTPNRKLLLFLDDLSRKCHSARQEINPRAESLAQPLTQPFQERLRKTLEAYESFCGKDEILVLATTRDERTPQYEGEPAEWDKLAWDRYPDLWKRFARYELPEPDLQMQADLLTERGQAAEVRVEDAETLARRNDGTLRNLVENLRRAANPQRGLPALTPQNFVDTLRGTWQERYRRAVQRHPEAKFLYQAAALLRRYGLPLAQHTFLLLQVAHALMKAEPWWRKGLPLWRAWRYLQQYENLTAPRDGQLEAAGPLSVAEEDIQTLIRLGLRHRLAEALDTLANELMWPDDARSSVYHPDAVRILRQVTAWQPRKAAAWYRLGVALDDSGEKEESIAAYQQAIALDEKDAAPWNGLGNVYRGLGRREEAIAAFQQAIALDEKFAYPWNNLGLVYADLGRREEAIAAFQKAIALDEKYAAPWNNLGAIYADLGRREEAIAAFQKAIALDEKDATPWNNLGLVYRDLGRREEAIAAYQQAIALDEKYAAPWNGLGNVYADLGRHEEAIAAFQKVIELAPESDTAAFAHNNLAEIYAEQRRFDLARHELAERIRLHPQNTFAPLIQLGVLARHEGLPESEQHFRQALAQWEQAWRDQYQSTFELLSGKAIALLCLGQKEEALQTLAEAIRQRLPGDVIDFDDYELLRTAPQPPEGIEEMIALLKG